VVEQLTAQTLRNTPSKDERRFPPFAAMLLVVVLPIGPLGAAASLVSAPLWLGRRSDYRVAAALQILLLACVACGLALLAFNPAGGSFSRSSSTGDLLLIARAGLAFGALLWCRTVLGVGRMTFLYGASGLLKSLVEFPPTTDANTWKYHYSWWLVLIALSLLGRRGWAPAAVCGLIIAVIASISEYRALFVFLAMTSLFLVARIALRHWTNRLQSAPQAFRALAATWAALAVVVSTVYILMQNLLLRGFFGMDLQMKTQLQIDQYGSIISGGRVEPPITLRLMESNPLGYGPGYVPTTRDYYDGVYEQVHSSNLAYLNDYTFGGHIKLHSFWGDLWVNAGPVGLVTSVVMLALVVSALSWAITGPKPQFLAVFLAVWGGWHVCFSPIYSNLLDFTLIAAVIAVPRPKAPGNRLTATSSFRGR
jgi:hypothetical protein